MLRKQNHLQQEHWPSMEFSCLLLLNQIQLVDGMFVLLVSFLGEVLKGSPDVVHI